MISKKIYIIVAVYNVENYLERCLNSLFSQTYKNFTVIAINDGSTDKSLFILEKYKKENNNLIIIDKMNGGLSSARNAGIASIPNLDNSLILFVDSDDYVSFDYVEKLVEAYNNFENCKIICSSYTPFYDDNKQAFEKTCTNSGILSKEKALNELLIGNIKCHAPTKLIDGSLFINHKFIDTVRFMEDQYLMPVLFDSCESIGVIDFAGYYYYHREGSLCRSAMTNNKIFNALNAYVYLYNYHFNVENKQLKILRKIIFNQFCEIYLMMYPRYITNYKNANDIEEWTKIEIFLKNCGGIIMYKPSSIKSIFKKVTFLFSKKIFLKCYKKFIN